MNSMKKETFRIGIKVSDIDYDHITEQPSRTDSEVFQTLTYILNQKKASELMIWDRHNSTEKTNLHQMGIDFRVPMTKGIREFKTWTGGQEKFKVTYRDRITGEFVVPLFPPLPFEIAKKQNPLCDRSPRLDKVE
jgi:hypothetical protein